ncbi:MAG: ABC transporter substrate-binding protein [Chloroflexota bacterium]
MPHLGDFGPEQVLMALTIFDGVAAIGADYAGHPYLAESITPNEDLTEWTVKIRPGVTFADGSPVDADAFKEIFDTYYTSEESTFAGALEGVTATVVDPLTVTYSGMKPNAAFPETLATDWPFSPAAAAAAGDDAGLKPAGTGPFVVESFTPGEELTVTRNPAYWRKGLPYLDSIEFNVIADDQTRLASFQDGQLDAFVTSNPDTIQQSLALQQEGKATVTMAESSNGFAILYNTQRAPLDDVRIRRALTHAIDQSSFVTLRNGEGIVAPKNQLFGPSSPWYSEEVAASYPAFDPAAAAALVEEYKNDPARSDGKAVGEPVTVTYTCPRDPAQDDLNQFLADSWTSIGVDTSWPAVDGNEFIFKVLGPLDGSERQFFGDFDAACWALGEQLFDPGNWLAEWFGQPAASMIVNVTDFEDPQFAADLDALRSETDPAARKAIMDRIGLLLNTELPNAWLSSNPVAIVARPELKNLDGWTLPDGSPGFGVVDGVTFLSQVWLEQ